MKKVIMILMMVSVCGFVACKRQTGMADQKPENETLSSWDSTDRTNDFYDDAETVNLPGPTEIEIAGEIGEPVKIDLKKLRKHSVIVKETILKNETDSFVGAYRYEGVSLYDILNEVVLKKANEKDFKPIIDLFVEVENANKEKVVLSWGEIYYPVHRHEVLIATQVMRIVPSKTRELWTLPETTKLVVGHDLITARNISQPVKITVKSYPLKGVDVQKDMKPLYSKDFRITDGKKTFETLTEYPAGMAMQNYPAIFYGRGKGIHSTQPFKGVLMKEILGKYFPVTNEKLMRGLFVAVAKDGYRSVYTYSEIMNRNDQSELLLIAHPELKDDAVFRLYPAMDFFSDRAVKALTEVRFGLQ